MVKSLQLKHFRSYADAHFVFSPNVTIVAGPNASGKTNLLEAVLMIARGTTYRAKDADLIQHSQSWTRLDAETSTSHRTLKITTTPPQKIFEFDGRHYKRLLSHHTLPVVLFEPDHLLLISGSPELRRNLLDDLLEQTIPGFGECRRHYKRILSQRNTLLKKRPKDLHEQLFVWNIRLSELGGKIVRERVKLLEEFNSQISETYSGISGRPTAITLRYISQFPAQTYETMLLKKLEHNAELDTLRGFTASGPHRDDLMAEINTKPFPETASRGEHRTLVLSLKILELQLLQNKRQTKPILLLDDVFSELDTTRRTALTQFVKGYQTVITTTDADTIAGVASYMDSKTIHINN